MQEKLYLRLATINDIKILFDWVNEPIVRQNSFNTNIISMDEHAAWLERVLTDFNTKLYILQKEDTPIGQVRLAHDTSVWTISYSIASAHRGQGYGTIILKLVENELVRDGYVGENIYAEVKKENIASQRVFEKMGYSETASQHDNAYGYTKVVVKEQKNGIH